MELKIMTAILLNQLAIMTVQIKDTSGTIREMLEERFSETKEIIEELVTKNTPN